MRYKPKISNCSSWVSLSAHRALRLNDHGITNQASVTCYIEEIGNATGPALCITVPYTQLQYFQNRSFHM